MSSSVNAGAPDTAAPDTAAPRQGANVEWLIPVAMGLLLAFLAWRLVQYVVLVAALVPLPYSIDYGEGVVMQQAMLIPGPLMYGDINQYPYLVFEYPPLFHLMVRAIASLGFDLLQVGRWTSVLCTFATAGLIATLVAHAVRISAGGKAAAVAAGAAALTIFTYIPVTVWSVIMRVDMFAVALSLAGIYLAMLGTRRRWLLYVAAVVFVLAVYTKQTMVSAPIATLAVLWLREPRSVRGPLVLALVLAGSALAWLEWQTQGRFLAHIIVYVNSPYSFVALFDWLWHTMVALGLYFAVVLIGLAMGWRALRARANGSLLDTVREKIRRDDAALLFVIFSVYFVLSTGTLSTLGRSGGSLNYLIEWMCVWSVIIGFTIGTLLQRAGGGHANAGGASLVRSWEFGFVPVLLVIQVLLTVPPPLEFKSGPEARKEMEELFRQIEAAQKPVVSDDMVMLLRAGKEIPLETMIFTGLAKEGKWDDGKLVDRIEAHAFAFLVVEGGPGNPVYDERYTKREQAAMAAHYPKREYYNSYVVMKPAD